MVNSQLSLSKIIYNNTALSVVKLCTYLWNGGKGRTQWVRAIALTDAEDKSCWLNLAQLKSYIGQMVLFHLEPVVLKEHFSPRIE